MSITAHLEPQSTSWCSGGAGCAAAPAWAWLRLCRSRLSRQGCGSRSLSSSDTVTPAPGAHTICSHSSRSCPQTARGAALLAGAGAGVRRQSRDVPASPAGNRHGWKGLGTAVRLGATRADEAGNTTGTGKGCTSGRPCPSTLTQAVPRALGTAGRGTGLAVTPVCHRSPSCTTRSRSTWGEAHPPRTPSSARVRLSHPSHPSTTAAPLMPPSPRSSGSPRHSPAPPGDTTSAPRPQRL